MTRLEMEAVINGGGTVLYRGNRITAIEDLPTQDEIDAFLSGSDIGVVSAIDMMADRLPSTLDADGGLLVHLQNPEDIAGGGGGVGLTDEELRATPVPISSTQLPASLVDGGVGVTLLNPEDIAGGGGGTFDGAVTVADGADVALGSTADADTASTVIGRLKALVSLVTSRLPASLGGNGGVKADIVGGSVSVSNLPATQPVSGTVAVSNLPATQAVSNTGIGATNDAEAAAGDGSLIAIAKRLRTLFGGGLPAAFGTGGGVKVDVVSGGATTAPAPVSIVNGAVVTNVDSPVISGRGYKGVRVLATKTAAIANQMSVQILMKDANGNYVQTATSRATTSGNAESANLELYPGNPNLTATSADGMTTAGRTVPDDFKVRIAMTNATSTTAVAQYQLLP